MTNPAPPRRFAHRRGEGREALAGFLAGGEFETFLDRKIAENERSRLGVLVIGLNRFRRINQLLGFRGGDLAIAELSRRVLSAFPAAAAGHLGGDEFAVCVNARSRQGALRAASLVLDLVTRPLIVQGHEFHMSACVGVAVYPGNGLDGAALLRLASAAMLRAKRRGGNAIEWSAVPELSVPEDRFRLESALHGAIERGELSLRYQPQVDRDGRLCALEALLVWKSAELGHVDTETFIRLAEESGIITPIGEWVLRCACRQIAGWDRAGLHPPRVAVNVSAQQFASPAFVDSVRQTLVETGVQGSQLELEVTESCILADIEQSASRMAELRALGVRIAIDDFGVGYSPLAYLHRLPLDTIKVDRSFVRQITHPGGSLPVVHTITVLAHHRGLQVVAEGVETESELELVRAARCDLAQGYFIGLPLPAQEISGRLGESGPFCKHVLSASASQY